jgi:hypothetical protein
VPKVDGGERAVPGRPCGTLFRAVTLGLASRTAGWSNVTGTPKPPRVDYELTRMGRDLLGPIYALGDWARSPC